MTVQHPPPFGPIPAHPTHAAYPAHPAQRAATPSTPNVPGIIALVVATISVLQISVLLFVMFLPGSGLGLLLVIALGVVMGCVAIVCAIVGLASPAYRGRRLMPIIALITVAFSALLMIGLVVGIFLVAGA